MQWVDVKINTYNIGMNRPWSSDCGFTETPGFTLFHGTPRVSRCPLWLAHVLDSSPHVFVHQRMNWKFMSCDLNGIDFALKSANEWVMPPKNGPTRFAASHRVCSCSGWKIKNPAAWQIDTTGTHTL